MKLPAMPETPPFKPMEFLPRSFTFKVTSTVLVWVLRLMSADSFSFSASK